MHRMYRCLVMACMLSAFIAIASSALFSGSTRVLAQAGQGGSYYVSTHGLDTNDGSLSHPFKTIQKCASTATAGDTCSIEQGTYHETVTPSNSGTAGAPITFRPYHNDRVVVDGADPVTGWTKYKGDIYQAHVAINPNLFANQVFVDGTMMLDARWPNGGLDPMEPARSTAGTGTTSNVIYDPALTQPAGFWNGATIHLWGYDTWASQTGTITNSQPGLIAFSGGSDACPYLCVTPGNRYYISGVLNALDHPTEWYYNSTTGTLYLWSPDSQSPARHQVEVKQRNNAFDLSGRSYITVQGLHIFGSTIVTDATSSYDVLDKLEARYISHTDTIIPGPAGQYTFDVLQSHVQDTGIQLNGSYNTLSNSEVGWSGGSGVVLNGNHQTVTNNLIHDIDYTTTYSPPVSLGGDYQTITHNTIYRSGRDAIGGGNFTHATISYNDIFDADMLARDAGTIYFCCQFQATGTRIDHNYIHDSQVDAYNTLAQAYGFNASGVYLDNSTGGVQVDHNVIWNTGSFGINMNGASVSNPTSTDNLIYNNTVGSSLYQSLNACNCDFTGTQVINNIFVSASPSSLNNGTVSNNLTSGTDPKFVNAGQNDFHLQAGSPAIDAGKVIPGVTDGYVGTAPDEGAYEYGGMDWTAGSTLDHGVLALPTVSTSAGNGQVTVSWDAVKGATGYKVKYGTKRGAYDHVLDVGNVTSTVVTELTEDAPYYFTVNAYDPHRTSADATESVVFPLDIQRKATDTIWAGSEDATSFVVNNTLYDNWINFSSDNNWLEYKNVDFGSGVNSFAATLAAPADASGKHIEVHLDSTTGPLISTLTIQGTSGGGDYNDAFLPEVAAASGASGTHDVYLVFKGQGDGFLGLLSLESFTFSSAPLRTATTQIQATSFDAKAGDVTSDCNGSCISHLDPASWVEYENVDFGTGDALFTADVGASDTDAGQKIEVHLDSPGGPLAGTLVVQSTGGDTSFTQQSTIISGVTGVHDVYLVANPGNTGATGDIAWFQFITAKDAGLLDRTGWVASASDSSTTDVPANALDGNPATRWTSGAVQSSGMYFQVDMQTAQTFSKVVLDANQSPNDYPRGYAVYVSNDGTNWGNAIATGTGSAETIITFPQQTARYIRVVQTESGVTGQWWSIHEFLVFA